MLGMLVLGKDNSLPLTSTTLPRGMLCLGRRADTSHPSSCDIPPDPLCSLAMPVSKGTTPSMELLLLLLPVSDCHTKHGQLSN